MRWGYCECGLIWPAVDHIVLYSGKTWIIYRYQDAGREIKTTCHTVGGGVIGGASLSSPVWEDTGDCGRNNWMKSWVAWIQYSGWMLTKNQVPFSVRGYHNWGDQWPSEIQMEQELLSVNDEWPSSGNRTGKSNLGYLSPVSMYAGWTGLSVGIPREVASIVERYDELDTRKWSTNELPRVGHDTRKLERPQVTIRC